MMKILRLTAENVKRLSVVEIAPNGSPIVVIAGENEAGKSSVLDAIEMALGGEKSLPPEPVRRGQEKAKVIADLGDIIVTRRFTQSGSSLTVTNREGAKFPSPQAMLDGLVGRLSFDPLAFASMKPDVQATTLRALAKIDTTDIETARKKAYDERTLVNRDVTQSDAALAKMPKHDGVGVELQSLDGLAQQLRAVDVRPAPRRRRQALALAEQKRPDQTGQRRESDRARRALRAELEQAETAVEEEAFAATVAEDDLDC
jgi:ribosomal silencing factor RsfS